jgi:hypothetical protein
MSNILLAIARFFATLAGLRRIGRRIILDFSGEG